MGDLINSLFAAGPLAGGFVAWLVPVVGGILGAIGFARAGRAIAEARRNRLNDGLVGVMHALGRRSQELQHYARTAEPVEYERGPNHVEMIAPGADLGGPSDADLQTAVDIAMMNTSRETRAGLAALESCTYSLKLGRVNWQAAVAGEIVGQIRKWRSGDIPESDFVAHLDGITKMARAQQKAHDEKYP